MDSRRTIVVAGTFALGLAAFAVGCGDDSVSGPMFGDVTFSPSFVNIEGERTVELTVRNASASELGPVLIDVDPVITRSFAPDSICNSISAAVAPTSFASLSSGGEDVVQVTIDTDNVDPQECPAVPYDADVFAAVSGTILGGATIRFDRDAN